MMENKTATIDQTIATTRLEEEEEEEEEADVAFIGDETTSPLVE